MDSRLDLEVKKLVRMGIPEDMAYIVACAKLGKPEMAQAMLDDVASLQDDIKAELDGFMPLEEMLKMESQNIVDDKNKESIVQYIK